MTNVLRKRENARLRLDEILEAIGYLHEDLEGHTVETLGSDRRARQLAERNLEIIYEGQKSLLNDEKTAEPGVDWKGLQENGNALRHEYWKPSASQIMNEFVETIPSVREALLRMRDRMIKWEHDHQKHISKARGSLEP